MRDGLRITVHGTSVHGRTYAQIRRRARRRRRNTERLIALERRKGADAFAGNLEHERRYLYEIEGLAASRRRKNQNEGCPPAAPARPEEGAP